jgi:hypothetical protein
MVSKCDSGNHWAALLKALIRELKIPKVGGLDRGVRAVVVVKSCVGKLRFEKFEDVGLGLCKSSSGKVEAKSNSGEVFDAGRRTTGWHG